MYAIRSYYGQLLLPVGQLVVVGGPLGLPGGQVVTVGQLVVQHQLGLLGGGDLQAGAVGVNDHRQRSNGGTRAEARAAGRIITETGYTLHRTQGLLLAWSRGYVKRNNFV